MRSPQSHNNNVRLTAAIESARATTLRGACDARAPHSFTDFGSPRFRVVANSLTTQMEPTAAPSLARSRGATVGLCRGPPLFVMWLVRLRELALNMGAHWPREFWQSGWNLFDLFVVVVSLGSYMTTADLPGVAMVRRRRGKPVHIPVHLL